MRTKKKKIKLCPKCGSDDMEFPALSRRDNKTKICPACGRREAFEDYYNYLKKKQNA